MNKKIIFGIIILVTLVVIGIIVIVLSSQNFQNSNDEMTDVEENNGISKLESIINKILDDKNYSFSLVLNNDNFRITQKNENSVKIQTKDEGKEETCIVKNGNTYLLPDGASKYIEYKENISMLNSIENNFQDILKRKFTLGKEKIENKEYTYEEFMNTSVFLINYKGNVDNNNTKTRFYFEGKDLKFIKTYVGKIEQLLKVDLEFDNQKGEYKTE